MTKKLKEEDCIGNPIVVLSNGCIVCSLLLLLFTLSLNRVDAFAIPIGIAATNNIKYSSKGLFSSTSEDRKKLIAYNVEYSTISTTQSFHTVIRSKGRRHPTLLFNQNHKDDETKRKKSSPPPPPIIDSSSITNLFPDANFLRVREDATLASCYGLCRFLIYDITTGSKDVPGWQLSDFIMLGGAFSSCIVLSTLWAVVGLILGVYTNRGDGDGDDSYGGFAIPLTAIIVGPLWLLIEIGLGWPPGGALLVNDFSASGADSITSVIYTIITGSIGLGSIMWLSKGWQ